MTNAQFDAYAEWLSKISDRALESLWITYCAPTEDNNATVDTDRALLIENEMIVRGLA